MTPRHERTTLGAWFANQIWNTSLVWLMGFCVAGLAFYFNTNNRLTNHETELSTLANAFRETKKHESAERVKLRDSFMVDSKLTATGIAELNKQTAVMGSTLTAVKDELMKINSRLDSVANKR